MFDTFLGLFSTIILTLGINQNIYFFYQEELFLLRHPGTAKAGAQINDILRWAKRLVFVIKLNLLLPCFELSALYLPPPDPARRPGITLPLYTVQAATPCKDMLGSILKDDALLSTVGMLSIYELVKSSKTINFLSDNNHPRYVHTVRGIGIFLM